MIRYINLPVSLLLLLLTGCQNEKVSLIPKSYGGVYPHLAYYNNEGECGTGAVVPWADRLWVVTYGPHLPFGSSDKLYEITPGLLTVTRSESVGGTPASRMIHRESNQLFIGPYVIDGERNVRTILPDKMPGRLTGNARHLTDPDRKIYYGTMEEGLYEVDVKTLEVKCLYRDGNIKSDSRGNSTFTKPLASLPGAHGKGLYSGQGVVVYSNNGELSELASTKFDIESGSLMEWDGTEWNLIRRNQFVEVTGPGGIYGNTNQADDPIWVTGWDHKSLLAGVRNSGKWRFYRLPRGSRTYDGAHGWNTEWPRIRNVGTAGSPFYLMTMHGMFWQFPAGFSPVCSKGIRPISSYLKVVGDFTRWNDSLVLGCDDSANREFLNKRSAKGIIEGPGQSNSNLWFTSLESLYLLGPGTAEGAVWASENVIPGKYSEPFLFQGWENRSVWLRNEGIIPVKFSFEVDMEGDDLWKSLVDIIVSPGESIHYPFSSEQAGEWIRIRVDKQTVATAHFCYSVKDSRKNTPDLIFSGLSEADEISSVGGLLWGLDKNRRRLGVLAGVSTDGTFTETGYYELDSAMTLVIKEDPETAVRLREKMIIPEQVVVFDSASVVINDDQGRRWRLPKGNSRFEKLTGSSLLRICREVATERDLFNCSGTFYELPAENADGFAKIRPIASHNYRIFDYASYRGMLIMTGTVQNKEEGNPRIIKSEDGNAAVWAGTIDDLWKLGKPTGEGGPWYQTLVSAGEPSDPYLIGFYDKRSLMVSQNSGESINFRIEADPDGAGRWMLYKVVTVNPGVTFSMIFPDTFQARWIRFVAEKRCIVTAFLKYE